MGRKRQKVVFGSFSYLLSRGVVRVLNRIPPNEKQRERNLLELPSIERVRKIVIKVTFKTASWSCCGFGAYFPWTTVKSFLTFNKKITKVVVKNYSYVM